jgi:hypothetical protein
VKSSKVAISGSAASSAKVAMMLLGFAGIGMAARRRGVGRALSSV